MKRLGFYSCISIFIVSFFSLFSSSFVYAQTTNSQGTYDYYQGTIDSFHSTAIQAINSQLQNTDSTATGYDVIQKATTAFTTVSQNNYSSYTQAFNYEKQINTPAVDAQIKGIQAWVYSMNNGNNLSLIEPYRAGSQRTAYDQYAKEVQDALLVSLQIKSGNIAAGSAEANVQTNASTITNAAAGNTNQVKQVSDTNPNQCSFLNGNILGCIDQIIAWLIKVTLLQLAGFLVWLSSNMLNLSIQVGILNFAQWAPDTLYPVWVIIRQIVSLFVVFAGLYLGFMYIIGREDTFEKYIPWIIMFALFVNFSYPLTRTLVDISNVVSLNIYASTVGADTLTGSNPDHTAGAMIMDRLGLQGLVSSATSVKDGDVAGFVGSINSTPGALVAVAFVFYAAFVFFKATWIIVSRTAILVFLTVGSPILFVDSVIPALGERASKMRTLYFEQLAVAPVFMIMLALTLKFLDVFQASGALSVPTNTLNTLASASSIQTFFNILMMLIMLHITIRVTESIAGSAGNYMGGLMGKVGGFGLGIATGGAGMLARGSIGMAAARVRDSKVMDTWQGTKTGRGLYSLTNSMANSTYDVRNIGAVSKGMTNVGMGMGKGLDKGYDERFKEKETNIKSKYGSIKDASARESYLAQKTESASSKAQRVGLSAVGLSNPNSKSDSDIIKENIEKDEDKIIERYNAIRPDRQQEFYLDQTETVRKKIDQSKSKLNASSSGEVLETSSQNKTNEATSLKLSNLSLNKETPKIEVADSTEKEMPSENSTSNSSFNLHTDDFAAKATERRIARQKSAANEVEKSYKPVINTPSPQVITPTKETKKDENKDDGSEGSTVLSTPPVKKPNPSGASTQTAKEIADEAINKARYGEKNTSSAVSEITTPKTYQSDNTPLNSSDTKSV